ncbi:MAG: cohesin domain-containing protein [Candidatus Spechtbacterales bacterium]|nr:cohesin domain-containing protein [Candidatus Spechtbacterales bacterium]
MINNRTQIINKHQISNYKNKKVWNFGIVAWRLFGICFLVLGVFAFVRSANAATLYIFPDNENFYEGQTFSADVRLDTEGERINAGEIELQLDEESKNTLELIDFTTGNSLFSLIVGGPDIDTENKKIFLQAAHPGGFEGDGVIGTLILKALNIGEANLSFSQESKLALADGEGTPAEVKLEEATYIIEERPQNLPIVESQSHPIESQWAGGTFIRMNWEVKEGATYSYVLSRNPNEVPDEVPEDAVGDVKLSTNQEGIFYFHLRECMAGGCGPVATRQVLRDVSPPKGFEIIPETEAGRRFLSFTTTDNISGVSYYEILEGTHVTKIKNPPYILKDPQYKGKIIVKAFDKAGNVRQASISLSGEKAAYNKWLVLGIIVSVAGIAIFNFIRKRRKLNIKNE